MTLNKIEPLLTKEEQDELIRQELLCCGAYDSESGCCPFKHATTPKHAMYIPVSNEDTGNKELIDHIIQRKNDKQAT